MYIAQVVAVAAIVSATAIAGPPRIEVKPVTAGMTVTAINLAVTYHTDHDDVKVSGRAEGVRNGQRVTTPLAITREKQGLFTVARQWDSGTAWVLVFSAEQGRNGEHGIAEGIVSVDARGAVHKIEYSTPKIAEGGKTSRVSREKVDAALSSMGVAVTAEKP